MVEGTFVTPQMVAQFSDQNEPIMF